MRVVVQRVSSANVIIDEKEHSSIGFGFLILLGIETSDSLKDIEWLCKKITQLRVFSDDEGKMNLSIIDAQGEMLVISQFTLHASTKKGNRPSFIKAARPEQAIPLYEALIEKLKSTSNRPVRSGVFGADMKVGLVNDGPVTIIIDSKTRD
jgi:D-tyrosyl-tRNA(Tyr) deacylase